MYYSHFIYWAIIRITLIVISNFLDKTQNSICNEFIQQ